VSKHHGTSRLPRTLRVRSLAILLALACVSPLAAMASSGPVPYVNWTALLPPLPGVPKPADPAAPCGVNASPTCVDGVIARYNASWSALDAACDPRAVWELVNLRATQAFRGFFKDRRGSAYFDDEPKAVNLDYILQELYYNAVARYTSRSAPPAWQIAFDAALSRRTTAAQDAMLGVNAHLQRDLPVALAEVGLYNSRGQSYKPDHDRINQILSGAIASVETEITRRYDPIFNLVDPSPHLLGTVGVFETIRIWREGAWRNAERLFMARTPAQRSAVLASIEDNAAAWARLIAAPDFSAWWPMREAQCRAFHASSAQSAQ